MHSFGFLGFKWNGLPYSKWAAFFLFTAKDGDSLLNLSQWNKRRRRPSRIVARRTKA
jgi:hypothetical protein